MPRSTLTKELAAASLALLVGAQARADEENGIRNSVAPVGDVDGDGAGDFALALRSKAATSFEQPVVSTRGDFGRVLLVSGRTGRRVRLLVPMDGPDLSFGRALEDLGDVDGDGFHDLALAALERAWIFSGKDGGVLSELGSVSPLSKRVWGLASGGDVDGDGRRDVLVLRRGTVHIALLHSGADGSILRVIAISQDAMRLERIGSDDWTLPADHGSICAASILPDLTGDGSDDLAVATKLDAVGSDDGSLFLLDGTSGDVLRRIELRAPGGSSSVPWIARSPGDLDGDGSPEVLLSIVHDFTNLYSGATGVELRRHDWTGGYLAAEGTSLEVLGDIDRDGFADYLVAGNEDGMDCDTGIVQVFSGRSGESLHEHYSTEDVLDGSCGVGADACGIGDVNGDGVPDLVVHLPRLLEARIHSGADFALLRSLDLAPGSELLRAGEAQSGGQR